MTMPRVDWHLIKRAMTGRSEECGDTGLVVVENGTCFAALVDVLGHGPEAHEVALLAEDFLSRHADNPLPDVLMALHRHLQGSRGCVAALCRLDTARSEMRFIGIGNVVCRVFGAENRRLLSRDGIVGYMASPPRETTIRLTLNDVVLLHTDGVSGHFHRHEHPGLLTGSAQEIAGRIMATFAKKDDDASCLVMRLKA